MSEMNMQKSSESRTCRALKNQREAKTDRLVAKSYAELGDQIGAQSHHITADFLEEEAGRLMQVTGNAQSPCGEVLPEGEGSKCRLIKDTLKSPDSASIEASIARTDLLLQNNMDITALAVDAAASIEADNSLEKMLSHQLAAAHSVSMKLIDHAMGLLSGGGYKPSTEEVKNIQAARLLNSANRLMSTYQNGLFALYKVRNGGNQTVTVQHVNVSEGGQAVIGNVGGGGDGAGSKSKKGDTP